MISKSNKFIKYASIAAIAIVALAASLSSNNINLSKNILRGRASDTIHGSITFSRATGTQVVRSNNYYYTSGSTTTGGTIYLRNASNVSLGNNYVAAMCGTFDKGSVEPEITFTVANSDTTQFGFQYISSITLTGDSTREVMVSKSNDGTNWNDAGTVAFGGVNTDVAGAKFLKLTYSNNTTLKISSFTITYYCSASGTPDVPAEKTLTGIVVKTAPTKVEYTEGDTFDPTGLVITASYDDLSSEDITYSGNESDFSFSPSLSTALSTSDTSIIVSYGGKSCDQNVTVKEASADSVADNLVNHGAFEMTCSQSSQINGTLTFTSLSQGVIVIRNTNSFTAWTETQTFNWTISNDNLTVSFSNVSSPEYSSHAHLESSCSLAVTFNVNLDIKRLSLPLVNSFARTLVYEA